MSTCSGASACRPRDAGRAYGTRGWRWRGRYAISKLGWIREHQAKIQDQARRHGASLSSARVTTCGDGAICISIVERDGEALRVDSITARLLLACQPGSNPAKRNSRRMSGKALLHEEVPALIRTMGAEARVKSNGYFFQRMKTKWGS